MVRIREFIKKEVLLSQGMIQIEKSSVGCLLIEKEWDPSSNLGPKFETPRVEDTSPSI